MPRLQRSSIAATSPRLKCKGLHVLTGGTGGLGLLTARWLATCGARALVLASRSGNLPARSTLTSFDASCKLRPQAARPSSSDLGAASSAAVHVGFGWDPANARRLYHLHGGLLRHVVAAEGVTAAARSPCLGELPPSRAWLHRQGALEWCARALTVRVDRLGSASAWHAAWRAALGLALGFDESVALGLAGGLSKRAGGARGAAGSEGDGADGSAAALARIVEAVAEPHRAAFVAALRSHLQRPRWPRPGQNASSS